MEDEGSGRVKGVGGRRELEGERSGRAMRVESGE